MAGIGESLLLVTFCGLCTFLTSVSLSAIATNGAMKVKREIIYYILAIHRPSYIWYVQRQEKVLNDKRTFFDLVA